jgi:hypothetical protein
MSVRCELTSNMPGNSPDSWEDYRVILRTPTETICKVVSSSKFSSATPRAEDIAKVMLDQPNTSITRMRPAPFEQVSICVFPSCEYVESYINDGSGRPDSVCRKYY